VIAPLLTRREARAGELWKLAYPGAWDWVLAPTRDQRAFLRISDEEAETIDAYLNDILVRLEAANEACAVRIVQEFRKEKLV
jgi:hypothetical protein